MVSGGIDEAVHDGRLVTAFASGIGNGSSHTIHTCRSQYTRHAFCGLHLAWLNISR
jgi:hypothetical protein